MKSNWIEQKLSEFVQVIMGQSPKSEYYNFEKAGIPFLQGNRTFGNLYPIYDTWCSNPTKIAQKNSVLMSVRAPVGDINIAPTDLCIGRGLSSLTMKNSNNRFLYYLLKANHTKILSNESGTVFGSVNKNTIENISVLVTSNEEEQKSIANILSSLDDKIELNNKINKNLEEIAQTLYKRWFVDFEFPNENGEPYKSSGGEMVDSELGMIPKGWEVKTVGDICSTVLGGTPSRSNNEYWNGNINWINSGEVNKLRIISASEKITWLGLNNSSTKLMPKKTTVIAITGATLGAVSLLEIESCANQSVIGIYESEDYPYTYVYELIINKIKDIIGRQTGGAQQHINKNDVNSFKIVVPVKSLIMSFHKNTDAFHKIIATNMFANVNLSKIRDELLPKLMSGEIEVLVEE